LSNDVSLTIGLPFSDIVSKVTSGAICKTILWEYPRAKSFVLDLKLYNQLLPILKFCKTFCYTNNHYWLKICIQTMFCSLVLWSDDLSTWTTVNCYSYVRKLLCKLTIFPFTVIIPSLTSTVTPAGITIGFYLFLTSYVFFY
jgi:hypothetical protein